MSSQELIKNTPSQHSNIHTFIVSGGGGGMEYSILTRLIARSLTERQIPYTSIDGISGLNGDRIVKYPSLQIDEISRNIETHPKGMKYVFMGHCIGTVAALGAFEKIYQKNSASLVSISPPFPSPRHTLLQPASAKKRSQNNTLMKIAKLSEGAFDTVKAQDGFARIDPHYFEQLHKEDDVEIRLRRLVEIGHAAVFSPEYDWNNLSPHSIRNWHEEWSTSLSIDDARSLKEKAKIIPNAAHGLNISTMAMSNFTTKDNLDFQTNNANHVIETGIKIVQNIGR